LALVPIGVGAAMGPFWSMPTLFLTGEAAAGGIALVASIVNVGGLVGPVLIGFLKGGTRGYSIGFLSLGGAAALGALMTLPLRDAPSLAPVAADKFLRDVRFHSTSLEPPIRWLGSTTFPMYAMHYPVLCLVAAVSLFSWPSWIGITFVTSAILASVALFTPVCELLKKALRLAILRIAYFNLGIRRL
jgi:hypothetical protein